MSRLSAQWTLRSEPPKPGGSTFLRPLAERLGVPFNGAQVMRLRIDDVAVALDVEVDSGVETGLAFTAFLLNPTADTAPFVCFRPETSTDAKDKATGLSREVELGLEQFDREVFIDSNATAAETFRVLETPEVRGAVRWLLKAGAKEVRLERGRVHFVLPRDDSTTAETWLIALEALMHLARVGPPRGAPVPRRATWLPAASGVVCVLSATAHAFAVDRWGAGFLVAAGLWLAGATLGAIFTWPLARRLCAGDSGSGPRARLSTFFLALAAGCLAVTAVLGLNARFDPGKPLVATGRIVSISDFDDDDDSWELRVAWGETDTTVRVSLKQLGGRPPAVGNILQRTRFRGGFGIEWGERFSQHEAPGPSAGSEDGRP